MKSNLNFFKGLALVLVLFTATSCALLESMFVDKQITTRDNVTQEGQLHAVPADLNLIPPEVRAKFEKEGKDLVLVDKEFVKDPEKAVDVAKPDAEGLVGIGLGIANAVWPGIAALEGLGLLFSQRKRQHYAAAVKQATPVNGKVELKDAIVSLGKALGVAHSSQGSKEVFEGEVKALKTAKKV